MRDLYDLLRHASISDKGVRLSIEEVRLLMGDIDVRIAIQQLCQELYSDLDEDDQAKRKDGEERMKQSYRLPYALKAYKDAVGGEGPLAYEWKDKPHRLVYDLVKEIKLHRKLLAKRKDDGRK